MKKSTLLKYSSLLTLFSVIGLILFIVNPLADTKQALKPKKQWKEDHSEPYSNPILNNATVFDDLDEEQNRSVATGTPSNALKFEIQLDTNCAIDNAKILLSQLSHYINPNDNPADKMQLKLALEKVANIPHVQQQVNDFSLLNQHDVLQSQIQLTLNKAMVDEINKRCAKRVYYRQNKIM